MNPAAVFALAVSLSMDSFAASLGKGAVSVRLPVYNIVAIAALFGLCEAAALAGGWAAGYAFGALIATIDHWVAFGLLLLVGVRMIHQAVAGIEPAQPTGRGFPLRAVMTAVATSIDAVVVGISLALIDVSIVQAVVIVGVVTFVVTLGGGGIGRSTATALGRRAEALGGAAMILIGTSILVQHLYF